LAHPKPVNRPCFIKGCSAVYFYFLLIDEMVEEQIVELAMPENRIYGTPVITLAYLIMNLLTYICKTPCLFINL
jgi:hypothetical protein